MIKAVVWDLGDVLCRFDPDRRETELARVSDASQSAVRTLLTELFARLDAGDMTGDQLLSIVQARLGWPCTMVELGRAWSFAFEPDSSVLDLARRLVVPAVLLTNNGPPISDHYRELLPAVAAVVPVALFSSHTHLVKPDGGAFLNACRALKTPPSEVLLIDDSTANVAAASRAGLQTHHYRSSQQLEAELHHRKLLL